MASSTTKAQRFSANLGTSMERLGVSRRELGRRLHPDQPELGRAQVKRHLRGIHEPTAATVEAYRAALGVELEELLPDDEEEERDVSRMVADLKMQIRRLERAVSDNELLAGAGR